ncbi:MAG: CHASE2 domain-containing protein, partial [Alphaproteobacteria bacterium]|nr:CHASE2 domain-containing protein [Alphaproteobacteria bacterium]
MSEQQQEENSPTKGRHAAAWWWAKIGTYGAVLLLFAMGAIRFIDPEPVEALRLKTFDFYNRLLPRQIETPEGQNSIVGIIDIDEKSLAEEGQFPWPRDKVAKLLAKLRANGAVVAGFDVVFPEPDKTNPALIADSLRGADKETIEKLKKLQSNDEILANIMRNFRVVLGQASQRSEPTHEDVPEAHLTSVKGFRDSRVINSDIDPKNYLVNQPTLVHNIGILEKAALGKGVFS